MPVVTFVSLYVHVRIFTADVSPDSFFFFHLVAAPVSNFGILLQDVRNNSSVFFLSHCQWTLSKARSLIPLATNQSEREMLLTFYRVICFWLMSECRWLSLNVHQGVWPLTISHITDGYIGTMHFYRSDPVPLNRLVSGHVLVKIWGQWRCWLMD